MSRAQVIVGPAVESLLPQSCAESNIRGLRAAREESITQLFFVLKYMAESTQLQRSMKLCCVELDFVLVLFLASNQACVGPP